MANLLNSIKFAFQYRTAQLYKMFGFIGTLEMAHQRETFHKTAQLNIHSPKVGSMMDM